MNNREIRVLIVDDHEVVRRGVRSLLEPHYEVCGEAVDGRDGVEKARQLKPDIVVMDVSMPHLNGLEATPLIRNILPACEVLILSQHESRQMVQQAFKVGARGYVVKSSISRDLLTAMEMVGRHEAFFDSKIQGDTAPSIHIDAQEVLQRSLALERALRESEELYRSTFELAAVGVGHVNPEGLWVRVNPKLCEIVGYTESEMKKLHFQDHTHPDDLARDLAALEEFRNGKLDKYSTEKRFIRKDGSITWIDLTVSAVRDAQGQLKHFISVIQNIDERRQAEEVRVRLAAIVQSSDDAIVSKDLNGIITSWNPGAERIFEFAPHEAVGRPITIIIPSELIDEERQIIARLRKGERIEHYETERVTKSGKSLTVSLTISPLKDSRGIIIGASKIARDITDRRRVEQTLQKSEARLRAAFGQTYSFLLLLEPDGTIIEANHAALEAANCNREEVVGHKVWEHWWSALPDEVAILKQAVVKAANGHSVREECCFCLPDGTRRFADRTLRPVMNDDNKIVMIVATGLDITEQKELREQLEARVEERTHELEQKNQALTEQAKVVRALSGRLLQIQDEERRRVARELHDSAGQLVASLQMTLKPLEANAHVAGAEFEAGIRQSISTVDQLSKELRTVSYLLHPPLLDEAGLPSAIRWYVEGFSQRSKINVELDLPPQLGRLSREMELTVFRIVQEGLTNIHRHANTTSASISVQRSASEICVQVRDNGTTVSNFRKDQPSRQMREGVGIQGMRERVRQLNGRFSIDFGKDGTVVSAVFPLSKGSLETMPHKGRPLPVKSAEIVSTGTPLA